MKFRPSFRATLPSLPLDEILKRGLPSASLAKTVNKSRGAVLSGREHMSTATVPNVSEALAQEFEEIFREHCQFVYRTAYSVTGNRPDAEDVLQNIFLKLLQREFPPDLKQTPRAYLYRAAVNLSLNVVRSRKNERISGDVDLLEAVAVGPNTGREDELQHSLVEAVAQLKPRAVEILILRYTHGYSDAQIAQMLGKSRGTIAVTLYRARARLRKLLSVPRMGEEH